MNTSSRSGRCAAIRKGARYLAGAAALLMLSVPVRTNAQLQLKYGNNTIVFNVDNNGVCSFYDAYREESVVPVANGEFHIDLPTQYQMWTNVQPAGTRRVNFFGRFIPNAIVPTTGALVINKSGTAVGAIRPGGDYYAKGGFTTPLADPSFDGSNSYTTAIYASSEPEFQRFEMYKIPTDGYATTRRDIADFCNTIDPATWHFGPTNVPINGILRVPDGPGPFPLVLFVHGNDHSWENSELGYIYLCNMLASQGIIAGTIEMNFLNGTSWETDARTILYLEHIKQFKIWNGLPWHPLYGRVDLSNIMIAGHSRGGEAVGHASYFNTLDAIVPDPGDASVPLDGSRGLGPYHFSLKCIFAMSPTDTQYLPVTGPTVVRDNYFTIQGGKGYDVPTFSGYSTFGRAQPVDITDPAATANGFKALCYFYGGNHTYFNTTWGEDGHPTVTRPEQEKIAKVYVAALARALLKGESRFLDIVRNHTNATSFLPASTTYVSEFQDKRRMFFNHYEEDGTFSTSSLLPASRGTNSAANLTATETLLPYRSQWKPANHTLKLSWSSTSGSYKTVFSTPVSGSTYPYLTVNANPDSSNANNRQAQVLTVVMKDAAGTSKSVLTSSYAALPFPNIRSLQVGTWPMDTITIDEVVLQSIRIPMSVFAGLGVNVSQIKEIQLLTNQRSSGLCYFDDMQFSF